jgi:AraC family transcriptional regulator, activator of mtrCDE
MPLSLDWLSRLLDLAPVQGSLDLRCLYGAPWQVAQDASAAGEIPYHVILEGEALLEGTPGKPALRLLPGDVLLLPHGQAHRLFDGGDEPAEPARTRARLNLVVSENGGSGARLDMLCGRFIVAAPQDRWLRAYLPPSLVVRTRQYATGTESAVQLAALVALMRTESAADNLGGFAMLNALSTAMFALVLRLASETAEMPRGLLALAGQSRLAPAVAAMFQRPAHPWTLRELANLCHMSRATLIRQFEETLGHSASELLLDIRMTLAARQLGATTLSTGAVAENAGYQSEAAFQRAFKARMGVTPAVWRRSARTGASPKVSDEV